MFKTLLLFTLVLNANCKPTENVDKNDETTTEYDKPTTRKNLAVLNHIENYTKIMTQYVQQQYSNLTQQELGRVQEILEEFLTNFARDLREVIEKQHDAIDVTTDAPQFSDLEEEIYIKMREQFPEISAVSAKEIVFRLKGNLQVSKQRLDQVINERQTENDDDVEKTI